MMFSPILYIPFALMLSIQMASTGNVNPKLEIIPVSASVTSFVDQHGKEFLKLMKDHFDLSLKYLYTSTQYNSQFLERPGLGKYLKEMSDKQWEEGLDHLKKYLQKGGQTNNGIFFNNFKFEGKGEVDMTNKNQDFNQVYVNTLGNVLLDSHEMTKNMNEIHHHVMRTRVNGVDYISDAEIGHYLDEKLEAEASHTRQVAGLMNNVQKMSCLGMAMQMFDSRF